MTTDSSINREMIEKNLQATQERLEKNQSIIDASTPGEVTSTRFYGVFEDALTAAGWARALGKADTEIKEYLATAARAAAKLFQSGGSQIRRIGRLPSEEEDSFLDTSMTNAWTYVRALYASLAANQEEVLTYLILLAPEAYASEQVSVSDILSRYVQDLRQVIAGNIDDVNSELQDILSRWKDTEEPADRYWCAQASALKKLIERDAPGFRAAMGNISMAIDSYYNTPDLQNNPERFLALPALGLSALSNRIDASGT